jgi:nucleoside 2-deoxyribosyltransferase
MKVFLSGGTRNAWHDRVKAAFPVHEFFDPRTLARLDMRTIAETERRWLDECDVLFFYLEQDNPSGLGSAFEVGYSVANSKPVVFVDERRNSHTEWLGIHCNYVEFELEAGIRTLGRLLDK